jgi:S1-C subfamily serine protease
LSRFKSIREMFREEGVALVIQPRFERIGSNYSLRVEIYDLLERNTSASTCFRIDGRYSANLAEELEVRDATGQPPKALEPVTKESGGTAWKDVYAKISPAVVQLVGKEGWGTGFVVAKDVVMTNSHVLALLVNGQGEAAVLGDKSRVPLTSLVVLKDDPNLDVALFRVDALPDTIKPLEFAGAERALVGEDVATLGHPKGTEGQVFSTGTLTSGNQRVRTPGGAERLSYMYSCATRGGNSGGPVVLRDGRVIAVHSAGLLGSVEVYDSKEQRWVTGGEIVTEFPGFALGARSADAKQVLDQAIKP